jgi:hypothetical protein
MKIKVIPEGSEGVYLIEKDEAIKCVEQYEGEMIHNFITGSILLGADWNKESVIEKINESERVGFMIGEAWVNNMRHALAVIAKNKLYIFDVGEFTEDDLDIGVK